MADTARQGPGLRMLNPVLNLAFVIPCTPSSSYYMCIYFYLIQDMRRGLVYFRTSCKGFRVYDVSPSSFTQYCDVPVLIGSSSSLLSASEWLPSVRYNLFLPFPDD